MKKNLKYILVLVALIVVIFSILLLSEKNINSNKATTFEWEKQISIYFGNSSMGSDEDCSKVFPVTRTILNAETFGPGAIGALLKGVSEEERQAGYFTSLNPEILLQSFEIRDGVAYVDFDSKFNEGVAGSCRVIAIRSQIENTLNNLPDIDSVVISVNKETKGILEP